MGSWGCWAKVENMGLTPLPLPPFGLSTSTSTNGNRGPRSLADPGLSAATPLALGRGRAGMRVPSPWVSEGGYSYSYSSRWDYGMESRAGRGGSSTSTALRAEYEYEYERNRGVISRPTRGYRLPRLRRWGGAFEVRPPTGPRPMTSASGSESVSAPSCSVVRSRFRWRPRRRGDSTHRLRGAGFIWDVDPGWASFLGQPGAIGRTAFGVGE